MATQPNIGGQTLVGSSGVSGTTRIGVWTTASRALNLSSLVSWLRSNISGLGTGTANANSALFGDGSWKPTIRVVQITQDDYDALSTPDANTLYAIVG